MADSSDDCNQAQSHCHMDNIDTSLLSSHRLAINQWLFPQQAYTHTHSTECIASTHSVIHPKCFAGLTHIKKPKKAASILGNGHFLETTFYEELTLYSVGDVDPQNNEVIYFIGD